MSKELEKARQNDGEAFNDSRRAFLKLTGGVILGAVVSNLLGGCRISKLTTSPETIHADKIRQQIRDLESKNWDNLTQGTAGELTRLIPRLYQQTFGKKSIHNQFFFIDNSFFKNQGLPEIEVPSGKASLGVFFPDYTPKKGSDQFAIPIVIFVGKPEVIDPKLNKLSVVRGILLHEFVHAQTTIVFETGQVRVGQEVFRPNRRRGLKWVGLDGTKEEKGWFFEEMNTQMIAEFLNDPQGQNPLWSQIITSPVYQFSLAPITVWGTQILRTIYAKLGISVREVENFHFRAAPQELLEKIDQLFKKHAPNLQEPPSSILLRLNPKDFHSPEELRPLKQLALQLS